MLKNKLEKYRSRKKKGKKKETSLQVIGSPATTATSLPSLIHIRVRQAIILSNTAPNPPQADPPPGHLYVIEGKFEDIKRYAGETVDWVIKVAHLICDPSGRGRLFTHTWGTADDWYEVGRTDEWRQVAQGERLQPGIYEYDSDTPIILSKISDRQIHSRTSLDSRYNSTTFSNNIRRRDGHECVVTRTSRSLIASHLVPKRMGSDGAVAVVTRFSGAAAAAGIDKFDPRIGILLFSSLDKLVDLYEVGFYHDTDNTYFLHNFVIDDPDLPVIGAPFDFILPGSPLPLLHLFRVTLSVHDGTVSLPETGTFDWHYLQCVIKVFGTQAYKNLPDIKFFVHPFKTDSDDSDDEFPDDDDIEPPWPTYRWDRFLREQGKRQMERERQEAVEKWTLEVSPGGGLEPS